MFNAVYTLSRESWNLEPWRTTSYCLFSVFCTLCRYGITFLDASILTQSVSGLQNPQRVDSHGFVALISARLALSGVSLGVEWVMSRDFELAERKIRQVRTQKVMAAFYELEFAFMTDKTFKRFMRLNGNITHYPTYFKESIDLLCRTAEVGFTAIIVASNIARLTPLLASFCVIFMVLNAVKIIYMLPFSMSTSGLVIDHSKAKEKWKPNSLAERRALHLQRLAFFDDETSRDIVLHGAADWLLESFGESSKQIPVEDRENDNHHLKPMFAQFLTVFETVGVPALSILFGKKISFEAYHIVQQSLLSICRNVSIIQEFAARSVNDAAPYADEYSQCLEMGASCQRRRALRKELVGEVTSVELRDVYFSYPKDDEKPQTRDYLPEKKENSGPTITSDTILKGITFEFERGKIYSIVGKNGGGKSTLVNIITKLHSPSYGSVFVNGVDLETISTISWHKRLAIAPQEFSQLHNFTIRENIGLGQTSLLNKDPTGVIEREAKARGITAFIDLETYIGSLSGFNGVPGSESEKWSGGLSGGQWQSIALARTLCRTFCDSVEVLIMDEPTSALDPLAEHRLFERLRAERAHRITIFISHRLQTARASDCILVIDEGILVQCGTHDELLLDKNGLYGQMYALQNDSIN